MRQLKHFLLAAMGILLLQACDSEYSDGERPIGSLTGPSARKPPEISAAVVPNVKSGAESIEQLARLHFETLMNNNEAGFRALWVTDEVLREALFLFNISEAEHDKYVSESLSQQEQRIERQLENMKKPKPDFEILEVEPNGLTPTGNRFGAIKVVMDDKKTGRKRPSTIVQEGLKVDGRWYFYERP